jgi:hypothetical protein
MKRIRRRCFGRLSRPGFIATIAACFFLAFPELVCGTPFTLGDLLVTSQSGNILYEYTRNGVMVQSLSVPAPPNATRTYQVGGVLVDRNGYVDVAQFGSGADTYLSAYQASTQSWRQISAAPCNGITNGLDLDLAQYQSRIYVSVISSYQLDAANNYAVTQLPQSTEPLPNVGNSAVSVGLNGLLYIVNSGSPKANVSVVNPSTFAVLQNLILVDASNLRITAEGLAATADGTIYAADISGTIYKYSSTGVRLGSFATGISSPSTLSLMPDGTLAMGSRFGDVYITNTSFSTQSHFTVPGTLTDYVGFVTAVPEPSPLILVGAGAIMAAAWRCIRRTY